MRGASSTAFPSRVPDARRFLYPRRAFWPSGPSAVGTPAVLRWFARNGEASPAIDAPAKYFGFSLSPDSRQLAFSRVGSNGGPDLWVRNLDTGGETQLTFDGVAFTPRWSPDGSRILFTGIAERPPPMLFIKDPTRPGAAQPLDAGPGPQFAASWSGHHLLSVVVGHGQAGRRRAHGAAGGGRPSRTPGAQHRCQRVRGEPLAERQVDRLHHGSERARRGVGGQLSVRHASPSGVTRRRCVTAVVRRREARSCTWPATND